MLRRPEAGRARRRLLISVIATLSPLALLHPATASPALDAPAGAQSPAGTALSAPHGRQRFWVADKHHYRSPWYAGAHRKMISFGCTRAPYYDPSPLCADDRGFHHGLDIAMPCGNRLFAGLAGRIVNPSSAGALGSAYGAHAFRVRSRRYSIDIVIGHVRRVFVHPGDRVRRGQRIARASDAGAPDGCHLHFEVRPVAGTYTDAVRPNPYLRLHRVS